MPVGMVRNTILLSSVVDTDPHGSGHPGSGSRYALEIRIPDPAALKSQKMKKYWKKISKIS